MRDVAIVGAAMTRFGRAEVSLVDLMCLSALPALHDAGLGDRRVDAVVVANMGGARINRQTAVASALVD
ncbi:MAG: acetyl-CoA acetyltransferase, partial [Candidatus Bipolaricaulota bacterium]|nr:acetyl-CoA acetyltransferase [Candidatus Bipolaricaulota bacterium]